MSDPVKILSTEIALSNTVANTISSASLVRLVNLDGAVSGVISITSNTGTVRGTFTLGYHTTDFSQEYIVKLPTDTLIIVGATPSVIRATSVAYT